MTDTVKQELFDLVYNATVSRLDWLRRKLIDPRRNINDECGFPENPVPENYWTLWDRDPIAQRVVEFEPMESWLTQPAVYEDEAADVVTDFEDAWDALGAGLRGKSWYTTEKGNIVWEYLQRVDILSGIGTYGVLLLGFDDVTTDDGLAQPVQPQPGRKLKFLRVFPEVSAPVMQYETDLSSERFSLPLYYNLTFNDWRDQANATGIGLTTATKRVHWSRVIHVADNLEASEVFGKPRMKSVLNHLLSLGKIYAASPEGYWKACFTLLLAETHPQAAGEDVDIDESALKNMFENMMNGLQRYGWLTGMSMKSVAPSVADPTPHINPLLEAICIRRGWPIRIFKGSERGDLASTMDEKAHKLRMAARCNNYLTPRLICPFIDRLIMAGALPEPEQYCVEWPNPSALTDSDKANILKLRTDAYSEYASSGLDAWIPPLEFMTKFDSMDEEEALAIVEASQKKAEEDMSNEGAQPPQAGQQPAQQQGTQPPAVGPNPNNNPPAGPDSGPQA